MKVFLDIFVGLQPAGRPAILIACRRLLPDKAVLINDSFLRERIVGGDITDIQYEGKFAQVFYLGISKRHGATFSCCVLAYYIGLQVKLVTGKAPRGRRSCLG